MKLPILHDKTKKKGNKNTAWCSLMETGTWEAALSQHGDFPAFLDNLIQCCLTVLMVR